jgi:3-hydroxy-9,10-secoandrosta-1,3,5(10)-triene-9,17-dione monooxygenase reductase component
MESEAESELRRSMGRFANGVTVVTCCAPDDSARGITANSFSSVSLDPPLVLWNIAKVSNSLEDYLGATHFAIHVLRASQQHYAEHFARADHSLYEGIDYEISPDRVPILPDVLARYDCATWNIHDAGDHHIIIGEILAHSRSEGPALIFHDGQYLLQSR